MCDNERYVMTIQDNKDVFRVFDESLTYHQAQESCKCLSDPSSSLALIKTDETFKQIVKELAKIHSKVQYWRIGLKRENGLFTWVDGEVMKSIPKYMINGMDPETQTACISIRISNDSGFFKPIKCEESYKDRLGYICSSKNYTSGAPQYDHIDVPSSTSLNIPDVSYYGSESTVLDQMYNGGGPSAWAIVIIVIGCIILLVLVILIFKKRRKKSNKSEQRILEYVAINETRHVAQGHIFQIGQGSGETGSVGYATIEEFQEMRGIAASNECFQRSQEISLDSPQESYPRVQDTYAVVNKKKSIDQNAGSSSQRGEVTYAVVNKEKT